MVDHCSELYFKELASGLDDMTKKILTNVVKVE